MRLWGAGRVASPFMPAMAGFGIELPAPPKLPALPVLPMVLVFPPLVLPDVTIPVTGLSVILNGLTGSDGLAIEPVAVPAAGETVALVTCDDEPDGCMMREIKGLPCVFIGSARSTSSHCTRASSI